MANSDKSAEKIVNLDDHRFEKDKEHYAKLDRASALLDALADFFRKGGTRPCRPHEGGNASCSGIGTNSASLAPVGIGCTRIVGYNQHGRLGFLWTLTKANQLSPGRKAGAFSI